MRKRICIVMITILALLCGCSKDKSKQALPKADIKTIEKVAEQVSLAVSAGNKNTKELEVMTQTSEKEESTESISMTENEQEMNPVELVTEASTMILDSQPSVSQQETTVPKTPIPEPQTPTSEPQTPVPEPETPMPQPPAPKSIYDYEFDVEAIKAELIAIGQGKGLTHITSDEGVPCTPDNHSWAMPVTATQNFQGDALKRALQDYVSSMPGIVQMTGGEISSFTIYVESAGNGSYTFYFLY